MARELIYTSAERGLAGLTQGYTTVARTRGMPAQLAAALERCSSFRQAGAVRFQHVEVKVGGALYHVLSRLAPVEEEVSGRDNFLAYHVALDEDELPRGGPAWLLGQPGFMVTAWDGVVKEYAQPRDVPQGDRAPRPCSTWARWAGDAGWAGTVAATALGEAPRAVCLLYDAADGDQLLALFEEALALLPPPRRWEVTFNTLHDSTAPPYACLWRCVPHGTDEARQLARDPGRALVLDLSRDLGAPPAGPLVEAARTGQVQHREPPAVPAAPALVPQVAAHRHVQAAKAPPEVPRPQVRKATRATEEPAPAPAPPPIHARAPRAAPGSGLTWALRGVALFLFLCITGMLTLLSANLYLERNKLNASLKEKADEYDLAQNERKLAEKEADGLRTKFEKRNTEIEEQRAKINEQRTKINEQHTKIKEQRAQLKNVEAQLTTEKAALERIKGENEKLAQAVKAASAHRQAHQGPPAQAPDKEPRGPERPRPADQAHGDRGPSEAKANQSYKQVARLAAKEPPRFELNKSCAVVDLDSMATLKLPDTVKLIGVAWPKDLKEQKFLDLKRDDREFTVYSKKADDDKLFTCVLDADGGVRYEWHPRKKDKFSELVQKHAPYFVLKIEVPDGRATQQRYLALKAPAEKKEELEDALKDFKDVEIDARWTLAGEWRKLSQGTLANSSTGDFDHYLLFRVIGEEKIRVDLFRYIRPETKGK